MFTSPKPYRKPLGDNLVMKSISTSDEIDRLDLFNQHIHSMVNPGMTRNLILHHPNTRPDHWLFVEDEAAGQIVSTLCLIPGTWRYEDVELKAGEMGIVGTHEDYRHRGLIRALNGRFKELLREEGCDLSHIQGIPFYYRQFGYEYTLPLGGGGGWRIDLHQIPDTAPEGYQFRRATRDDIPRLMAWYDEATQDVSISAVRSAESWAYLLEHSIDTDTANETWLVLDASGTPVGYWGIEFYGFGTGLNIYDTSRLSHPAALASLAYFKKLAQERGKPYVRLILPPHTTLVRSARAWGAADLGFYAWQIHLPDIARLLRKMTPIFERRIAASAFAGLTETVCINLYREAFDLCFVSGKLTAVNAIGYKPWGGTSIPPTAFTPLVLGYRSREELAQTYHDLSIWGQSQFLFDVLFPKVEAYIYTMY